MTKISAVESGKAIEKPNETNTWLFLKINKINKFLFKLTKQAK